MLSHTKKSAGPQRKTSAKLPKLTIQQQIDNNEVIERMNRKITFSKNQRHLAKTLPYAEAFQSTSGSGSLFRVEPSELYFSNFDAGKIYESEVKLVNKSKHIQRIKITPLQKKQFVVFNVKYPIEDSGDIAPGMQVSIFIRFKPLNLHDNEDQLLLIVGDGVIRVPIKAQREKCKGEWPTEINCGHCWVGDQQNKHIQINNLGGQAIYYLQGFSQSNEATIGAFTISPTQIKLQKNKKSVINVNFSPSRQGSFSQKICLASNQGEEQKIIITLKGGAYSAQVTLDEINGQNIINKKFHNYLYINDCEPGKQSKSSFKVHNHAVVAVDYLWYYEAEPNFQITQNRGKISPAQVLNFSVSYKPSTKNPKTIHAYLYLFNLPKQSILNNSVCKKINGIQMIQCLQLQIRTTPCHSNIQVIPLHKKIAQKLYMEKPKRTNFTIQNNSSTDRTYWLTKVKQQGSCIAECQVEGQKIIKANQTQQIWFNFVINKLDRSRQNAFFLVNFDNLPAKMISIEGSVEFPDLLLEETEIEFQLLRTHSTYRKCFRIVNDGENDVYFSFTNPHRHYRLDFYDFYEFEDEKFYQRKLRILDNDQQCQQLTLIKANSEKTLQFELSTKTEEIIDLDLQLNIKDGRKYHIKITGDVQDAFGKISQNFIPLKQIFQGNIYNSNKFLPRQLSIDCPGNVKIRYQIIPPQIQECSLSISPLNGIIEAKSKRRIDLVLQPLKTGTFNFVLQVNFYDDLPLYSETYSETNKIIEIVPEARKKLIKTEELKIEGIIRGVQTAYYIKDESRAKKVAQKLTDDGHGSVKMSNYSYKSASASRSHYLQSYKILYPPLEQLNFYNAQINKVQQLQIIVQNNSEITTQYQIFAETFRSIQKAMSQTKSMTKGMMQGEQLAFTSNLGKAYIENRALNQAQKIYLSNNKGISIMCEPNSGVLHKRQSQKIVVTMFNDTSGRFKDNLVISVKDHEVRKFPINMQIKGTPVSFSRNQLGIDFNSSTPVLDAGIFLMGSEKSSRNIKVINNGPREVQIKWVIYPYGTSNNTEDLFNIKFSGAQAGSNNLVQTIWESVKPKPLQNPPFTISPSQKMLKGRQQANFQLTVEGSDKNEDIKALIIGQSFMIEDLKQIQKQANEAQEIHKQHQNQEQQEEDSDESQYIENPKQKRVNKKNELKKDTQKAIKKVPMQELAIIASARIVSPKLKLDQKHENHINKFERFAQIGNEHRTKANDFHRKIKLKNQERCSVGFTIQIKTINSKRNYFEIVSTSTNSPLNKLKQKTLTTSNLTLKTKQIYPSNIQSQFTLAYDSYVEIGIDLSGNPKDVEDWPLQSKIRKDGQLIIHYLNGQQQIISLVGWLYRPFITIQMPNDLPLSAQNSIIDFGVVHINNHKKKSIYLTNPTKSAANWNISYVKYKQTKKINFQKQLWTDVDYEDENIIDQKKCFRLSQDSGHLLAQSIPIHYMPSTLALQSANDIHAELHQPSKVDFVFKPQSNVLYKSKFIIKVQHGITYEIIVRGRGTFEEQAQIK